MNKIIYEHWSNVMWLMWIFNSCNDIFSYFHVTIYNYSNIFLAGNDADISSLTNVKDRLVMMISSLESQNQGKVLRFVHLIRSIWIIGLMLFSNVIYQTQIINKMYKLLSHLCFCFFTNNKIFYSDTKFTIFIITRF